MSKLPQVEFAPDAPPALDCIIALTKCTIGGEIDDALVEDPSNVWMVVSRVVDTGLDRIPLDNTDVLQMVSAEEGEAWIALGEALQAGDRVLALRRRDTPELSAGDIPWELIIQLAVSAFQRWMDRRRG